MQVNVEEQLCWVRSREHREGGSVKRILGGNMLVLLSAHSLPTQTEKLCWGFNLLTPKESLLWEQRVVKTQRTALTFAQRLKKAIVQGRDGGHWDLPAFPD